MPKLAFFLALLTLPAAAQQAPIPTVLDWKAPATLPTYLLQQVHQQYVPRRAALDAALASAAGIRAYRDSVQARFRRVLGPLPARTPLRARVMGTVLQPGFRIEKITYESTPHHHVTANLYLPDGPGRHPAALLFCGHENTSKATPSYQLTARLLARNGFVVLVIDPVSQGERMQLTDASGKSLTRGGTTEHTLLNAQATLLGTNLPAEQLWDNVRSLDYLLTRPEVDAARVGCLGNSGGATQAAYFMAYDDRVQAAALCSYVASGERNLTLTGPADGCVQLPGAGATGLDVADWPLSFAPKPLLLLTGRYDFVDQTDMEAAFADTQQAYTALGEPAKTAIFTYDDGHGISAPKRAAAAAWFRRWLGDGTPAVPEDAAPALAEAALRCTATGQVGTSFSSEQSLATIHLANARALARHRPAYSPTALAAVVSRQLRQGAAPQSHVATHIDWRDTLHLPGGQAWQSFVLRRVGEPPLPARLLLPARPTPPRRLVLWLPGQGMATVLRDSAARLAAYQRQGTAVLLADLRGLGETTDPAAFNDPKYYNQEYRDVILALHLGRPLLAQRVLDVSELLGFVRNDARLGQLPILLRADGRAALAALHAAVVCPQVVKAPSINVYNGDGSKLSTPRTYAPQIEQVQVSGAPPSFTYFLENPAEKDAYSEVLPGVLRYYDVPDLRRALGSRLLP